MHSFFALALAALASRPLAADALGSSCTSALGSGDAAASDPYWYQSIDHQGSAPYASSGYSVYRDVTAYGATGDGTTDDTAAINDAITAGSRCGNGCNSSTLTPAVVYFPSGTYVVSSSIIPYYYTALIGDAKNPPTLLATSGFSGNGIIDADPYGNVDNPSKNWWQSVNNFYGQISHINIDMTALPDSVSTPGIHWQVAQASEISYVTITMPQTSTTQLIGIYSEDGSGGYISDVEIVGGAHGIGINSQQFTIRNVAVSNAQIAVHNFWNWAITFQNFTVSNCGIGIYLGTGDDKSDTNVGSAYILDWTVTSTPIFVQSNLFQGSESVLVAGIVIDNAALSDVTTAAIIDTSGNVVLAGPGSGSSTIDLWIQGDVYQGTGAMQRVEKTMTSYTKPSALTTGGKVFGRSRPFYETYGTDQIISVKSAGAKGDATTDDTAALQAVFDDYAGCKIIYFDAGIYLITDTLTIPEGSFVIGEYLSTIMASGSNFASISSPKVAVQVGNSGDTGSVEISNILFSSRSPAGGAILLEWNVAGSSQGTAGMWNSHFRIGGAEGTNIQVSDCLHGSGTDTDTDCQGAFLAFHLTASSSAYVGNTWTWAADHDIEDATQRQIDTYSGRGILVESTSGPTWLVGVASEHHTLYQFNFASTSNIYAGLLQTETPYYQPDPAVPSPFTLSSTYNDPSYPSGDTDAWALNIQDSSNIIVGGAGFYSFFEDNADTTACVAAYNCQDQIVDIDSTSTNVRLYSLSTVGSTYMVSVGGTGVAEASANVVGTTAENIALWASADSTLRSRVRARSLRKERETEERVRRSRVYARARAMGI